MDLHRLDNAYIYLQDGVMKIKCHSADYTFENCLIESMGLGQEQGHLGDGYVTLDLKIRGRFPEEKKKIVSKKEENLFINVRKK